MVRIILAACAGTIVYFLIGWLVFEGLLGDFMEANTTQIVGFKKSEEEASIFMLLLSCAAYALLLAIVLGQWLEDQTVKQGVIKGAIIGILVATMTNSYWFSSSHFFNSFAPILADIAAAGLTVGIMGGSISWTLRLLKR